MYHNQVPRDFHTASELPYGETQWVGWGEDWRERSTDYTLRDQSWFLIQRTTGSWDKRDTVPICQELKTELFSFFFFFL